MFLICQEEGRRPVAAVHPGSISSISCFSRLRYHPLIRASRCPALLFSGTVRTASSPCRTKELPRLHPQAVFFPQKPERLSGLKPRLLPVRLCPDRVLRYADPSGFAFHKQKNGLLLRGDRRCNFHAAVRSLHIQVNVPDRLSDDLDLYSFDFGRHSLLSVSSRPPGSGKGVRRSALLYHEENQVVPACFECYNVLYVKRGNAGSQRKGRRGCRERSRRLRE